MVDKFDEWTQQKKMHNQKDCGDFHVNPRDIWYIAIGQNIGSEENGKKFFRRPVLVIKKVGSLFFVIPLTSQAKESIYSHRLLSAQFDTGYETETSMALLSQAKVVDKRRFLDQIGYLPSLEFRTIKQKLTTLLL